MQSFSEVALSPKHRSFARRAQEVRCGAPTLMRSTIWPSTVLSSVGKRRQKRGMSRSDSVAASVEPSGSPGHVTCIPAVRDLEGQLVSGSSRRFGDRWEFFLIFRHRQFARPCGLQAVHHGRQPQEPNSRVFSGLTVNAVSLLSCISLLS